MVFRRSRPSVESLAAALTAAAIGSGDSAGWALRPAERVLRTGGYPLLTRAADAAVAAALAACWRRGWQPVDVWQVLARRQHEAGAEFVAGAIAAEATGYPAAALHPRWRAQLAALGADATWWDAGRPYCAAWAEREGVDDVPLVAVVIEALAHLTRLPVLQVLIPPPGTAGPPPGEPPGRGVGQHAGPPTTVDPKVLSRVRALLAKAESTEFAEEAEAFFAKAQELISRYALERAVLHAPDGGLPGADGRRVWLDNPYLSAKSLLVTAVARANRCRAVFTGGLGFVTVLGEAGDVEIVEVLSTSLLVQAGRAMVAAGRQADRGGQSRTRSYRQAFLAAYAERIGERLAEASRAAGDAVAEKVGENALLPVLAAREAAVARLFADLFPGVRTRRVGASNAAGWGAGRAAAEVAVLDAHRAVRG